MGGCADMSMVYCSTSERSAPFFIGIRASWRLIESRHFDPGSEYLERNESTSLFFVGCCLVGDGLCPNADVISLLFYPECAMAHGSTHSTQNLFREKTGRNLAFPESSLSTRHAGSARNKSSLNKKNSSRPKSARSFFCRLTLFAALIFELLLSQSAFF